MYIHFSILKKPKQQKNKTTTFLGGSPLSRGFSTSTGCPLPQLFPTSSTAPLVHVFVVRLLTVDDFLVFFALFLCNNDKSTPSGKFVLLRKFGVISPRSDAVIDILLSTDFCKNCKLDMVNLSASVPRPRSGSDVWCVNCLLYQCIDASTACLGILSP